MTIRYRDYTESTCFCSSAYPNY